MHAGLFLFSLYIYLLLAFRHRCISMHQGKSDSSDSQGNQAARTIGMNFTQSPEVRSMFVIHVIVVFLEITLTPTS